MGRVLAGGRAGGGSSQTPRAAPARVADADKSDRLTPADTMDKALAEGRIQLQARRDEISAALGVRREWARKRYESLPKAKEIVGLPASS